ncbi:MAG TPA: hypothetical protein VNJ01_05515 [Bacteriovoracaceae bacterium]|nr:hypothetical protein [Bacteriovoracaceae bacterium]
MRAKTKLVPEHEAIERDKNFNSTHGILHTPTSGYHETWTIFLCKILKKQLEEPDSGDPLLVRVKGAIQYLNDFREITRRYYSRELLMSREAPTGYLEPGLTSLDW